MTTSHKTHVTKKRHYSVVSVLVVICLTLIVFLILLEYSRKDTGPISAPSILTSTSSPHFLQGQEVLIITSSSTDSEIYLPIQPVLFQYVEIKNSCEVHFEGECVVARTGPGLDFPVVTKLRNDVVLRVGGQIDHDGHTWYKIIFDEFVRYPERIPGGMYVAADNVNVLLDEGEKTAWEDGTATTTKRIVVDRATQKLYAYNGDTLFMETVISTGLELSPTVAGTFTVYKKLPVGICRDLYRDLPMPMIYREYHGIYILPKMAQ